MSGVEDEGVRQLDVQWVRKMLYLVSQVRALTGPGSTLGGLIADVEDAADRRDLMHGDAEELAHAMRELGAEIEQVCRLLSKLPVALYSCAELVEDEEPS